MLPPFKQHPFPLPYKIRARIRLTAARSTPADIVCCEQRTIGTDSHPAHGLRPFSDILETVDPIHVARYASKPSSPNAKFVFCSMPCFALAMRMSKPEQRQIMSRGWVCVAYSKKALDYILSTSDAVTMIKHVEIQTLMIGGSYAEIGEEALGEGEGRVAAVRAKMFRKMERMAKNYFDCQGGVLVSH